MLSLLVTGDDFTIGASIIPNTSVGVPYYNYSIMGPQTLF